VPRCNADRSASRPTDRQRRFQQTLRPDIVSGREVCYVVIKPCGCVVAAIIPAFCSNRDIGHRLGPALRKNWDVERMRLSEARDALTKCPHETPAKQGDLFRKGRQS
jgi:hypothetical protein